MGVVGSKKNVEQHQRYSLMGVAKSLVFQLGAEPTSVTSVTFKAMIFNFLWTSLCETKS